MLLIALTGLMTSFGSSSASYDCSERSLSNNEKIICDKSKLSNLDEKLNTWFSLLKNININRQFIFDNSWLRDDQLAWLKKRNACNSERCLISSYEMRLSLLQQKYIRFREITSVSFIESLIKSFESNSDEPVNLINVVAYTVDLEGDSEYLVATDQWQGPQSSSACGSGSFEGYWFIRYNSISNQAELVDKEVHYNCNPNPTDMVHTIFSGNFEDTIIRIFKRDIGDDSSRVQVFEYVIGSSGNYFRRLKADKVDLTQ
jgi:uncharacterized protein